MSTPDRALAEAGNSRFSPIAAGLRAPSRFDNGAFLVVMYAASDSRRGEALSVRRGVRVGGVGVLPGKDRNVRVIPACPLAGARGRTVPLLLEGLFEDDLHTGYSAGERPAHLLHSRRADVSGCLEGAAGCR